ncbi:MAG: chromate efflux transporter, partial [Bacteroidetes bacterium]|nr:chromate efflux transporter [Bacteroidota bacterium]
MENNNPNTEKNLVKLASLFFRLGLTAFGGPAAHIAMMEDEVVEKRKWMSREHFLDLVGATNLIPGPNSTEMVMHTGMHYGGIPGLFIAGICFIFPAAVLTGILGWFYKSYGELPAVAPFLMGIKPAVLAIILAAVIKLGKKALKKHAYAILGLLVIVAALWGINEVVAILAGGLIGMLAIQLVNRFWLNTTPLLFPLILPLLQAKAFSLPKLFLVFLKIGAILFGSGYVLVAYLEGELVDKLGWLTQQQLLD